MKRAKQSSMLLAFLMAIILIVPFFLTNLPATTHADGQAEGAVALTQMTRAEIAEATLLGPLARDREMSLTLAFKMPDRARLDAFILALHDERSPQYHRWITPQEFGQRFGLPANEYQANVEWLRAQGFQIKRAWPNRLAIDFSGNVALVEKIFHTEINNYQYAGQQYFSYSRAPQLPAHIAESALTIIGMENFSQPMPQHRSIKKEINPDFSSGGQTALGPRDFQAAYNSAPLLASGIDGTGMTIAIAARSDFNINDAHQFRQIFGLPTNDPVKKFPFGAVNNMGGIEEEEVVLDAELSGAAAPNATVQVIISPMLEQSLQTIYNDLATVPLINFSFGACEASLGASNVMFFDMLYAQGVAQGQTTFVASGDTGADQCSNGTQGVNGLASSPNAVAVGGTTLNAQFDQNGNSTGYGGERAWDNSSDGATGGGASMIFNKPAFQIGAGVPNDNKRDLPDISLMADPGGPGYFVLVDGHIGIIGGTSASSPSMAGVFALLEQFQHSGPLGNANFRIYALGGNQANSGPMVYNDVTIGNNSFNMVNGFSAGPNYDQTTGWGSVNIDAFVRNFFTQQSSLPPVQNLQATANASHSVTLNWQAPAMTSAQVFRSKPSLNVADLNREMRSHLLPISNNDADKVKIGDYHFGFVPPAARSGKSIHPLDNQPPEITSLTVTEKNKNKALANFSIADPDGDIGFTNSGLTVFLFDSDLNAQAAIDGGDIFLFTDKTIFPKPLPFFGMTSGSFNFSLKGLKTVPTASIWVSAIRDDAGNLNLAPAVAGIVGHGGGGGATPQIVSTDGAIMMGDDVVGVDINGSDSDADTVGMTLSFLDSSGNVVYALGIAGDPGSLSFVPFSLDMLNNPVRGMSQFLISFSLSGLSDQVMPGTIKAVAVSLVDANGNRSAVKVIDLTTNKGGGGMTPTLQRYNVYRSMTSPVLLSGANLIGSVPSGTTTFTDSSIPGANGQTAFHYVVTAVYDLGESPASNEVMVKP